MSMLDRQALKEAFQHLGVRPGDTVLIYANLARLGPVQGGTSRSLLCSTYIDALREILAAEGTIIVPTYTNQVARFDQEFVLEETPAITGILSEHVRCELPSCRSIHPIHSLCAVGARASRLCQDNGVSDFGWHSPFHRLHGIGAKVVALGLPAGYALGLGHYVEFMAGVPHIYNKLLKWRPVVGGKPDPRPFVSSVRHLSINVRYDFTRWAYKMRDAQGLRSCTLGRAAAHLASFDLAYDIAAAQLRADPYFLLREVPNFQFGQLPFDGPTGGRDGVSTRGSGATFVNWAGFNLGSRLDITARDLEPEPPQRPVMPRPVKLGR